MKKIFFLLIILSTLTNCKCKKAAIKNPEKQILSTTTECPDNAKCSTELLIDSALKIEKDGAGKPYYTIIKQAGTTVYRYLMAENQDQQYVDGGYREEIIFQLSSDFKNGTILGKEILETQALFGVFCFCKDKAGYYPLKEATITKKDQLITVSIPVIIDGQKVHVVVF